MAPAEILWSKASHRDIPLRGGLSGDLRKTGKLSPVFLPVFRINIFRSSDTVILNAHYYIIVSYHMISGNDFIDGPGVSAL